MHHGVPFFIATSAKQLEQLAARLAKHTLLGVDTESNSLHAYRERLCLVQFSTVEEDAVVDPLAVGGLSPLAGIFSNPQIEKVFHAAEYDLIVLNRDYGFPCANLFDTMMAARILGRKKVGLGNLLEEEFGIKLEKRYQRADWGERPLRREMLEYARLDTHHLIELRQRLKAELEQRGRWELAREDFDRLPQLILAGAEPALQDVWRIKGARDLNPRQAAVLQELAIYREARAAEADVPLFKIMGDSTLSAIATAQPQAPKDLEGVEGMTPGQMHRHGKGVLEAVKRGEQAAPLRRPKRAAYDEAYVERLDKVRAWRKAAAAELEVESDVVLPRDIMEAVARSNPRTLHELEPLMAAVPWRLKTYAAKIVAALHPN
ncbi:MAG: HRDC domain-containing protein [Anaerolineales bacterium]